MVVFLLIGAFLEKWARLLQWPVFFLKPKSSPCMYHFLIQTLAGLRGTQRSRVRVLAPARRFFVRLRNRVSLKGLPSNFFRHCATFFLKFFVSKASPFYFLIVCNEMKFQKPKESPHFFGTMLNIHQKFSGVGIRTVNAIRTNFFKCHFTSF